MMAGLREVERTGEAVHIDVAMLDTALMLMASLMSQQLTTGWKPEQSGNAAWSASPSSGAFETADGMLMLAANNESQFRSLCAAIGRGDILADARWRSASGRRDDADGLRATLEETFRTRPADHWEAVLAKAEVPAARVRRLDEVLAEPQVRARGLTSEIRLEGHDGPVHLPTMSFKANGENVPPRTPPASLGGDTEEVLAAAGVAADRIAALRAAGVI